MKIFVFYQRFVGGKFNPVDLIKKEFDTEKEIEEWITEELKERGEDYLPIYRRSKPTKESADWFLNTCCTVIRGEKIKFTITEVPNGINVEWPDEK